MNLQERCTELETSLQTCDDLGKERIHELEDEVKGAYQEIAEKNLLIDQLKDQVDRNNDHIKSICKDHGYEVSDLKEEMENLRKFIVSENGFSINLEDSTFQVKMDNTTYHGSICGIDSLDQWEWLWLDEPLPKDLLKNIIDKVMFLEESSGMATIHFNVTVDPDLFKVQIYSYEC